MSKIMKMAKLEAELKSLDCIIEKEKVCNIVVMKHINKNTIFMQKCLISINNNHLQYT